MSDKNVRVGFVGCGYMGQLAHIANYAVLPGVELAAVADLRPETPRAVAARYGIANVYRTHDEMLAAEELDAVVAIMYFGLHAAVVPDILRAGKHLLTEKPICQCPDTARGLDALARENNAIYHVGYMKRCDPASQRMRDTIATWKRSGAYGNLKYLRVSMPPGDWVMQMDPPINLGDAPSSAVPAMEGCPAWMSKEIGGKYVAFINFYIHQVNLVRFLLGEDYTVEYVDPSELVMVARTESGVTVVLEMNTFSTRDEWVEEYVAHFDRGRITMALPAPMARQRAGELELYYHNNDGAVTEKPVIPPLWSMKEQARTFMEEVRGNAPNISPAADAAKDLEVAEAFIRLVTKGNGS